MVITENEINAALNMLREPAPEGRRAFGIRELARRLECSYGKARRIMIQARSSVDTDADIGKTHESWVEDETGDIVAETRNYQCRTLEDLLNYMQVDTDTWRVTKHVVNQWGKGDMLQVKAWLSRKVEPVVEDALKKLVERLVEPLPASLPIQQSKLDDPHMLVISPVDHHFGKLAWGPETGEDYDLKKAELLYVNAIDDALEFAAGKNIEEIHIPVGHDIFHFDTVRGTTASDTQMDVDTRPQKVFVSACFAVAAAIDRAARVAPVTVHYVRGNHDPSWSHHLCVFLWGFFRNNDRVRVDYSPMGRKYVEYGINLNLMTHGDMSQKNIMQLPLQLAVLEKEAWGRTSNWEVHLGHFHHQKEMSFVPLQEQSGVVIRILPSLCGTDEWHFTKGFVGNRRAMMSLLYSKTLGYVGQHVSYAKDLI